MPKTGAKLSTAKAAERLGFSQAAVKKWCQKGLFPKAELVDTPRGPVWEIPESDLQTFRRPAMGRPVKRVKNIEPGGPKKAAKNRKSAGP